MQGKEVLIFFLYPNLDCSSKFALVFSNQLSFFYFSYWSNQKFWILIEEVDSNDLDCRSSSFPKLSEYKQLFPFCVCLSDNSFKNSSLFLFSSTTANFSQIILCKCLQPSLYLDGAKPIFIFSESSFDKNQCSYKLAVRVYLSQPQLYFFPYFDLNYFLILSFGFRLYIYIETIHSLSSKIPSNLYKYIEMYSACGSFLSFAPLKPAG